MNFYAMRKPEAVPPDISRKVEEARRHIMASELAEAKIEEMSEAELAGLAEQQLIDEYMKKSMRELEEMHDQHFNT